MPKRSAKEQKPRCDRFDASLSDDQRDTIYEWMSSKSCAEITTLIKDRFGLSVSAAALSRWRSVQYALRNSPQARLIEGLLVLKAQVKRIEQGLSLLIDELKRGL